MGIVILFTSFQLTVLSSTPIDGLARERIHPL
jgi:hypothetical protein